MWLQHLVYSEVFHIVICGNKHPEKYNKPYMQNLNKASCFAAWI